MQSFLSSFVMITAFSTEEKKKNSTTKVGGTVVMLRFASAVYALAAGIMTR